MQRNLVSIGGSRNDEVGIDHSHCSEREEGERRSSRSLHWAGGAAYGRNHRDGHRLRIAPRPERRDRRHEPNPRGTAAAEPSKHDREEDR